MTAVISTSGPTGRNFSATLQKVDNSGVLGDYWDASGNVFAASPVFGDKAIALTEGSAENLGSYSGGETVSLDGYTGWLRIRIHDTDDSNKTLVSEDVYFINGRDETFPGRTETLADLASIISTIGAVVPSPVSPVIVAESRTWHICSSLEGDRANQIVTLSDSSAVTLAMDFREALNPDTSISSVAVVETSAHSLTIANKVVSQDKMAIHFDVSALTQGLTYSVKCTATTTDSQSLIGFGDFKVT